MIKLTKFWKVYNFIQTIEFHDDSQVYLIFEIFWQIPHLRTAWFWSVFSNFPLRDVYLYQIWWIFGKLCCAFFRRPENLQRNSFGLAWPPPFPQKNYRKNRNENFWIGNDPPPPHSEVFRKFIEFGPGRSPLARPLNKSEDYWEILAP